jgi:hypothetical protein
MIDSDGSAATAALRGSFSAQLCTSGAYSAPDPFPDRLNLVELLLCRCHQAINSAHARFLRLSDRWLWRGMEDTRDATELRGGGKAAHSVREFEHEARALATLNHPNICHLCHL